MKLEDLRINELESVGFFIQGDNKPSVIGTYQYYTRMAWELSLSSFQLLENPKNWSLTKSSHALGAINLWFLTLESYVNCMLKLTCEIQGKIFDDYKKKDLEDRIIAVIDLWNQDKTKFYTSNIYKKVKEFLTVRNELFLDRISNNPLRLHKTHFNIVPFYANQVDIMQCIIIIIEFVECFRYGIKGLDITPHINIIDRIKERQLWMPIDWTHSNLIVPYINSILAKHSMSMDLSLTIEYNFQFKECLNPSNTIECKIKARDNTVYSKNINYVKTNSLDSLITKIVDNSGLNEGEFRLGLINLSK
jgi:hypothetical protein